MPPAVRRPANGEFTPGNLATYDPATRRLLDSGVASDAVGTGGLLYKGTWNATTNSPAVPAAASGNNGWYYRVATAGSTNLDGITDWKIGDWAISNGLVWQKIDNTDQVSSVAGRQGAVTLATIDLTDSTAAGRALVTAADVAAQRAAMALGTLATQNGTFSGTSSGTNTGDQTSVSGNAGTATKLATARTISGVSFDGTANIVIPGIVTPTSATALATTNTTVSTLTHSADSTYDRQPFAFITGFATGGINQVPTMTSDSTPSGISSASSVYSGNSAYYAFDTDNTTAWINNGIPDSGSPGILQYQFGSATVINGISIICETGHGDRAPVDFKFQGSANGSAWTDLSTQTGISGWADNTAKSFAFSNTTAYPYYRIRVTANGAGGYLSIGRLRLELAQTVAMPVPLAMEFDDTGRTDPRVVVSYPDTVTTHFKPMGFSGSIDLTYGVRLAG